MIMPRGQQLLMPANPVFIVASLVAALAVNMLPLGIAFWRPDALMLLLAFWSMHQPLRIGMGVAFALGLCMDVQQSSLLGQHALAYSALMYGVARTHRRLLWYSASAQAPQMAGLFALTHAVQIVVGLLSGGGLPGWSVFLAPLLEATLWPLASWLLLAPQRRAPERDEKRKP
ncbi:MAG: rod shape-determining protein MreD [Giesbergeria sp.]